MSASTYAFESSRGTHGGSHNHGQNSYTVTLVCQAKHLLCILKDRACVRLRVSDSVLKTSANLNLLNSKRMPPRRRFADKKIKNEEEQIRQGGGAKAIDSQHKKGR